MAEPLAEGRAIEASNGPHYFTVLGVRLAGMRFESAVARLLGAPALGERIRVHFCTAHTLVEASDSERLRAALEKPALVATDGMPLVWIGRARGAAIQRVCGPDLMAAVLDRGRTAGYRHFFMGGAEGVPEELAVRMSAKYPGLLVAGTYSPPFRPPTPEEDRELVARLNAANADYVWVGLGSPKQELWLADHRDLLDAPVLLAVGAAFDFYSGRVRRAPRWMQRTGTEWLFRLAADPRRLWRRYTVTNMRFAALLVAEAWRQRAGHNK